MRIVVTGGNGFIGRNLRLRLSELGYTDVTSVGRESTPDELARPLAASDFVFHLAGVNRPSDPRDFDTGNRGLTATVCSILRNTGRRVPLVLSSSIQASLDNPYGRSKRAGEFEVERYAEATGAATFVFRLSNVFGKWCRPNYNSAVATFCHNLARGLPITIQDPNAPITLVYIDDVVAAMVGLLAPQAQPGVIEVRPNYLTTMGEVTKLLSEFASSRQTLKTPRVGTGLLRALHATYLSYLAPERFAYSLRRQADPRGAFVEVLKTADSGQLSYFTAGPGVTRGGHYHHSKTEKFLVLKGHARFGFRHVISNDRYEIAVSGEEARIVETVPGWAHDITNVGSEEMIVMLWASEIYDPDRPDTIAFSVTPVSQ